MKVVYYFFLISMVFTSDAKYRIPISRLRATVAHYRDAVKEKHRDYYEKISQSMGKTGAYIFGKGRALRERIQENPRYEKTKDTIERAVSLFWRWYDFAKESLTRNISKARSFFENQQRVVIEKTETILETLWSWCKKGIKKVVYTIGDFFE